MNQAQKRVVDAYSASPAVRLQYTILAAKGAVSPLQQLRRLREEAADEVERPIAFLDLVDGYALSEIEGDAGEPDDAAIASAAAEGWTQGEDDEEGHDVEQTDGRPVLTAACGRVVRL